MSAAAALLLLANGAVPAPVLAQAPADALSKSFLSPPPSARPQVWWHWINGNISKAGITADLEAMKRVGIGGGTICVLGDYAPEGPVHFNSPLWWDDTKFAMSEAGRLGLDLGVENCEGWSSSGGPWVKPEDSMKDLCWREVQAPGGTPITDKLPQPETRLGYYRDVAVLAFPSTGDAKGTVKKADIIDVTSKMSADGALAWTPPAGNWTIIRIGYTAIGITNHPASKYGIGLETDKLSRPPLERHFAAFFDKVMEASATIPGKPVNWSLLDSYETGPQNWTDAMPAEFKARKGYDITPWLITMTGRTVESPEQTSRFQYDFTRAIADLWNTNYYGYFTELLHKHGLKSQVEAYGNGTFDTVRSSGLADMPMSEFWYPGVGDARQAKQVASAAHLYGKSVVGAESFTAGGNYFDATPWRMKREGDNIMAAGVNLFYFHSGAHQPWTDGRAPGMTWDYGIFQNRNNTWYESGKDYFAYLARCGSMLRQGRFIGDILAYEGEEGNGSQSLYDPPIGYASDEIDRDLMMSSVSVQNGALVLPSGQRYRILALPNSQNISLPVLEKIEALARDGAIIFGPRPIHTLGLNDYAENEEKLAKLTETLWGPIDGKTTIKNKVGKGWIYWTGDFKNSGAVLSDLRIAPDFAADSHGGRLRYLHRRIGGADSYFLSSQAAGAITTNVTFRVSGKQPEIWDPQKGTVSDAPVWSTDAAGNTRVALHLDPAQSLFVVFRKPASKNHLTSVAMAEPSSAAAATRPLKITKAIYGDIAGHGPTVDITSKLASLVVDNEIEAAIGNDFAGGDPAPNIVKSATVEYTLGGVPGTVSIPEGAALELGTGEYRASRFKVATGANGQAKLITWAPGSFQITRASGKTTVKHVTSAPAPVAVKGPWTVHFDPRWGGPKSTTFDSLVDWTQRPESGIKYYSGAAEYDKTIDIPAAWLKPGRVAMLDLGDLESLANVTLNGRDLGCLWSPPYRVDVTGLLKPGPNTLSVKVTNTWVNRLIGDAGLPQDQRLTSITKPFYSATDHLIPSGLFGPVTVIGADPIAL
ncbi:hypothetical protein CCAX7_63080 [Capsulimonas corticalis]|uniref:Beta-mannosidase-like galactose-binding domain-containing protein n=1 Tax=Capsulimonas corticalis TaxID=2219043 RepID=A0A402CWR5_9BACT|nr:glycosyl hydrolase [Capsulimonas corticalis]BDI34257.1 hypothetical protein CCAX7_63080 [Capsulimonas corticalis]